MNTTQISCRIVPTYFPDAPPLHLTIKLDGQTLLDQDIQEPVDFVHEVEDQEARHLLEFEMLNKSDQHTPWDSQGQILGDCQLQIEKMSFDGIELTQIFSRNSQYLHSYNDPNGEVVTDQFYEIMGCNGVVRFEFETPVYLWLLENM